MHNPETLEELVGPVVENEGFMLVRVRMTGGRRTPTLQVMAERPDRTMSVEDCARLSRALSPVLETADPVSGPYTLEVSSPGINRPLVRPRDFHDWQGWPAKLELKHPLEGRRRFTGILGGLDGGKVAFDIDGQDDTVLFPLDWIADAALAPGDDRLRNSAESVKPGDSGCRSAGRQEQTSFHGDCQ